MHALQRWAVLLVVGLALLVRLAAAWEVNTTSPDSPARLSADEPGYDNLARELLAGDGLSWPGRVPLYPAWLAGLHYVTGYSYARGTLVIVPWVVRNHLTHGAIYPLATSNAILWQGSPEYFHLVRREGYTYLDVWNKVIYGPGNEGNDPGSIEGDRYWTRRALRSIAAEPLVYLRFCLEKAVTYWIGDPNADWGDTFVFNYRALREWGYSRFVTAQYMLVRAFPLVAFAALLWLRPYWPRLLPVLTILAYCTLLHAITHAEARLSDPLQPLLLVIFAAGVCAVSGVRMTPDDARVVAASRPGLSHPLPPEER